MCFCLFAMWSDSGNAGGDYLDKNRDEIKSQTLNLKGYCKISLTIN